LNGLSTHARLPNFLLRLAGHQVGDGGLR